MVATATAPPAAQWATGRPFLAPAPSVSIRRSFSTPATLITSFARSATRSRPDSRTTTSATRDCGWTSVAPPFRARPERSEGRHRRAGLKPGATPYRTPTFEEESHAAIHRLHRSWHHGPAHGPE